MFYYKDYYFVCDDQMKLALTRSVKISSPYAVVGLDPMLGDSKHMNFTLKYVGHMSVRPTSSSSVIVCARSVRQDIDY